MERETASYHEVDKQWFEQEKIKEIKKAMTIMENKTGNIITHFGRTRASKSNKKQAIPAHPTSAAKQKNETESAPSQSPAL